MHYHTPKPPRTRIEGEKKVGTGGGIIICPEYALMGYTVYSTVLMCTVYMYFILFFHIEKMVHKALNSQQLGPKNQKRAERLIKSYTPY